MGGMKKVQNEMTGLPNLPVINICTKYTMPKSYLDKAFTTYTLWRDF